MTDWALPGIVNGGNRDSYPLFFDGAGGLAGDGEGARVGSRRRMRRYPGAKAADGVFHRIIGLMPPHDTYIEAFVGSGAILTRKKPATSTIVVDVDTDVADFWRRQRFPGGTRVVHDDAIRFLREFDYSTAGRVLVYADPPYVLSARRSALPLYRHEMTDAQHAELLTVLRCLPCAVLLSGYRCALYDAALASWQRFDFQAMTHAGPALESVWINYPLQALHDWRYLGGNFRERERIKRKQERWRRRLSSMPAMERAAMLALLLELASPDAACLDRSAGELPV